MTITETTPPACRTFSIQFTEDELKMLGVITGITVPDSIKKIIDNNSDIDPAFRGVEYIDNFILSLYEKLINTFQS